jgi:HK97 family phage major capsid protein
MSNSIVEAIEKVAGTFEEFKKVNDKVLEEQEKKHESRAAELSDTLQKIASDLDNQVKERTVAEKKARSLQDRLEILEALNDRPRGTVQDKVRGELSETFVKCLRSGFQDLDSRNEYKNILAKAHEVKAVTIGTAADGGYAVPEEISRAIEALILKQSDIVASVKNVTAGTSDYKELVSVFGTTSAWIGETGSRAETGTAGLRERAPTWGELYAYPKVSNWALEDVFFNVVDWLVGDASQGMSQALATAIYSGNGSAKPTGMVAAAPTAIADYNSPLRAGGVFEYVKADAKSPQQVNGDDIIDLVYKLAPGYRTNAKFMMNTVTQGHVRKLKDTTGQYLWQPALSQGQPDRLCGYMVATWEDLGNPTVDGAYPVMFGDFSRAYLLVARSGLAIDRNPFGTIGYTSFYVRKRYGGIVLNNDAVKVLKIED